jgi:hypothetical protein
MALQEVPVVALRVLQVVQGLGVLAVVPATAVTLRAIRSRAGAWPTAAWVLVLLALAGLAWFAITFKLFAPSMTY